MEPNGVVSVSCVIGGEAMRARRLVASLTMSAVVVVAACTSNSATAGRSLRTRSSPPTTGPSTPVGPFKYFGPVSASSTLDGGDVHLAVPPAGATPAVSPSKAFAASAQGGGGASAMSATATMRLALVTTTAAGTARSDGSINPLINDALTYIIVWTGRQCPSPAGPVPATPQSTTTVARQCHLVEFVSATTGKHIYAFECSD